MKFGGGETGLDVMLQCNSEYCVCSSNAVLTHDILAQKATILIITFSKFVRLLLEFINFLRFFKKNNFKWSYFLSTKIVTYSSF